MPLLFAFGLVCFVWGVSEVYRSRGKYAKEEAWGVAMCVIGAGMVLMSIIFSV